MKTGHFLTSWITQFSVADYRSSKLYKDDEDGILGILEKQNVTFNFHHWCITEEVITVPLVFHAGHILLIAITMVSVGALSITLFARNPQSPTLSFPYFPSPFSIFFPSFWGQMEEIQMRETNSNYGRFVNASHIHTLHMVHLFFWMSASSDTIPPAQPITVPVFWVGRRGSVLYELNISHTSKSPHLF